MQKGSLVCYNPWAVKSWTHLATEQQWRGVTSCPKANLPPLATSGKTFIGDGRGATCRKSTIKELTVLRWDILLSKRMSLYTKCYEYIRAGAF